MLVATVAGWVSREDAQGIVIAIGVMSASLTAIAAAARLPWISRPGRWLWRRLIAEPFGAWVRHQLDAWADDRIKPELEPIRERLDNLEAQHRRNGGRSTRDRLEAIATAVEAEPAPPDDPEQMPDVHPF